jgi:hypothetical protein
MDQKLIWFFLLGKVLADQKTFTKNVQDFKKIICISILLPTHVNGGLMALQLIADTTITFIMMYVHNNVALGLYSRSTLSVKLREDAVLYTCTYHVCQYLLHKGDAQCECIALLQIAEQSRQIQDGFFKSER